MKTTLETSEEDKNYTRNEWRRWKLHSNRVKKMKTTLEKSEEDENYTQTSGEDENYTRMRNIPIGI